MKCHKIIQSCIHTSGTKSKGKSQQTQHPEFCDTENPNNASAVISTLTVVTFPVPNRRIILSLNRLEMTVHTVIVTEIMPA